MTDGPRGRDVGHLLGEIVRGMRANRMPTAAAILVLTMLGMVADLAGEFGRLVNFGSFVVSLGLEYELTLRALADRGFPVDLTSRRRLFALLGLNLLTGIGILLALVLLVLPGLYLFVRWFVAVPVLIAEEASVGESLTRSAEEVKGRFWPVAGTLLVVASLYLAAVAAAVVLPPEIGLLSSFAVNLPASVAMVAMWHAAVAIYAAGKGEQRLEQVFA